MEGIEHVGGLDALELGHGGSAEDGGAGYAVVDAAGGLVGVEQQAGGLGQGGHEVEYGLVGARLYFIFIKVCADVVGELVVVDEEDAASLVVEVEECDVDGREVDVAGGA